MINKIEIRIFEDLSYEYKSSQCEGIGDADAIFGPTIQRSGIHFTYSKDNDNYLPKYFVNGDPSLVIKWLIYHDRNLEFVINKLKEESRREERLDVLKSRMEEMNIPSEKLDWYLDTRRFGTAPHSGFGLGLERFMMFVTGMNNIRDVIPFPRTPGRIDF